MKEEEIRPQDIFDEYLRLSREDIKTYFLNANYRMVSCPACGEEGSFIFNKYGFNYKQCNGCKTIYMSFVPDSESFNKYYSDSPSTEYWATTFYKETEDARREKLWKPKAQLILDKCINYDIKKFYDIGGGYGIFAEEFAKVSEADITVIEPSVHLSKVCRSKGITVIESFLENIDHSALTNERKCFVSFELFEHLDKPKLFLESLYNLMNIDDIFIFTTLSGMGLDIQVLWEDSKAISPPHHLNFFNPKSIDILLKNLGFKLVEVTTPGKLDISIMNNSLDKIKDNFWKNFLEYSNELELENMQKYLSTNLLSSHMMVVCQKI